MKRRVLVLVAFLAVLLAAIMIVLMERRTPPERSAFASNDDCVVFKNDMTMDYDVEIGMRRDATGNVRLEAYRLEYVRDDSGQWRFAPRLLQAKAVPLQIYEEIVRELEAPDLKVISSSYPPAGLDGWTWKFKRRSGGKEIAYSFWCPEWTRDAQGIGKVIDLGRQFIRAADLSDLFPRIEKEPNQAPEPTALLGRGSP